MDQQSHWYAVYTKPRWEKKVHGLLTGAGIEAYCPLSKVRRKWSDRFKVVELPLFSSYVFVRIPETAVNKVRQYSGILNFVYWNGKPGIVKDEEILSIRKFLNEFKEVSAIQLDIKPKSKVIISQGAMMGKEAVVERVLHNIVELEIESLGYKLVAKVEKSNLFPVDEKSR
ncbi:MAG: UpxY family transcription antiterminator [Chitinophagaceae bacterium]